MKQMLSFVIPCYNSKTTISKVVNEIKQTVENSSFDFEIILVNDSSPDNTIEVLYELSRNDKRIKIIDLSKNFSQHNALMAGYANSKGDIVISLDDDFQTPANEVFRLIDKLSEGYDVVFAKYEDKRHNAIRNLGSKINDLMARVLINKPKKLYLSSYFVAKRFVINKMLEYKNSYPYISGLVLRTTNKIANVLVNHRDRENGKSNYSFGKLIALWMNGFTAFSIKPLRVATVLGFISAGSGFLYGIYIIIKRLINNTVPLGYSSIMATLIFIGGILMIVLGLIGEYVGRIYISINNSPQYCIREKINFENEE